MVRLNLVTTPIGNLGDISKRAIETLNLSDLIIAEDTRTTRSLLDLLEIPTTGKRIIAFHDHNKAQIDLMISQIKSSSTACLVSDAGSPIISDPAFPLVRACIEQGIEISTLPGGSAVMAALELSGLPPQPFTFHGFFGRKKGEITGKIDECSSFGGTHIFFESPHRIETTLKLLAEFVPGVEVAICREVTKKFESVYRFKAQDWQDAEINIKGEFVVLIYFPKEQGPGSQKAAQKLAQAYMAKKTPKNLSKLIAEVTGLGVSEVYSNLSR